MTSYKQQQGEDCLSENDVILLVKRENKDQGETIEKIYLKKSTFNNLIAEWKPYINGIKWFFIAVLMAFGTGMIALVFNAIKIWQG